jgi:hypothetical protein
LWVKTSPWSSRLLQLDADLAVLRLEAAFPYYRSPYRFLAQHVAHRDRLVEIAVLRQKFPETRGGVGVQASSARLTT